MRILFIIPEYFPDRGGIATYYYNLINALSEKHDIKILIGSAFTNGGKSSVCRNISVEYLQRGIFEKYQKLLSKFDIFPQLKNHLASAWSMYEQANHGKGYDIVETTDWGLNYIPWVLGTNPIPIVTTMHGSIGQIGYFDPVNGEVLQSDLVRMIEIETLKLADELHTYSFSNQKFWEERLQREINYIPPPFKFTEKDANKNLEFAYPPLVVGRIQYWKGPTVLCEALSKLGKGAPSVNWIGRDTNYKNTKESMDNYLKNTYPSVWKRKVKTHGSLSRSEVSEYQSRCRFGIVPSTWDMFNFTCIEFMAHGKPVICSEGAGASHLIENAVNGFTYPDNDPGQLADLISRIMKMPESELKDMGEKAGKFIKDKLDPEKIVQIKTKRYEKLLASGKVGFVNKDWLERLLNPEHGEDDFDAFLDHQPLKKLAKYSLKRAVKKFKNDE